MEATSTRRAGLERFTFPRGSKPYFALDLANDLPASWAGGHMDIDPKNGRITIGGFWGSRWVTGCDQTAVFLKKIKVLVRRYSITKPLLVTILPTVVNKHWMNTVSGPVIRKCPSLPLLLLYPDYQ